MESIRKEYGLLQREEKKKVGEIPGLVDPLNVQAGTGTVSTGGEQSCNPCRIPKHCAGSHEVPVPQFEPARQSSIADPNLEAVVFCGNL